MDIDTIKTEVVSMADRVGRMLDLIEEGFIKNRPDPLASAMKEEGAVNEMEEALTKDILEFSKTAKKEKDKNELSTLESTVEMLERMGDEAASLIERIEIKVNEKLLFSEAGVEQFNETYAAMKKSVEMMRNFLKSHEKALKGKVVKNGLHVKDLVERYRKEHADRLVKGLCTPIAANMYFDMLDFTGNLARHSSNIVKLY